MKNCLAIGNRQDQELILSAHMRNPNSLQTGDSSLPKNLIFQ